MTAISEFDRCDIFNVIDAVDTSLATSLPAAPHDLADAIDAIYEWAREVARDCDWAEGSFDVATHELSPADIVRNMGRHYDGGMRAMVADALANMTQDEPVPNPVVARHLHSTGATIREYSNGTWDAVDGPTFSLSLGFDSRAELEAWIEEETLAARGGILTVDNVQDFPHEDIYQALLAALNDSERAMHIEPVARFIVEKAYAYPAGIKVIATQVIDYARETRILASHGITTVGSLEYRKQVENADLGDGFFHDADDEPVEPTLVRSQTVQGLINALHEHASGLRTPTIEVRAPNGNHFDIASLQVDETGIVILHLGRAID